MYNLLYAKSGQSPKRIQLKTRLEVVDFMLELGTDSWININGKDVNWAELRKNKKINRYLKIKKLNNIK